MKIRLQPDGPSMREPSESEMDSWLANLREDDAAEPADTPTATEAEQNGAEQAEAGAAAPEAGTGPHRALMDTGPHRAHPATGSVDAPQGTGAYRAPETSGYAGSYGSGESATATGPHELITTSGSTGPFAILPPKADQPHASDPMGSGALPVLGAPTAAPAPDTSEADDGVSPAEDLAPGTSGLGEDDGDTGFGLTGAPATGAWTPGPWAPGAETTAAEASEPWAPEAQADDAEAASAEAAWTPGPWAPGAETAQAETPGPWAPVAPADQAAPADAETPGAWAAEAAPAEASVAEIGPAGIDTPEIGPAEDDMVEAPSEPQAAAMPAAPVAPAPPAAPVTPGPAAASGEYRVVPVGRRRMLLPNRPPQAPSETPVRALIGEQLRTPIVWCELERTCISWHADREALGVADVRARAIAAGWRVDALGRLACPQCQQTSNAFRTTQPIVPWNRAYALTMAARQAARQGNYQYPQPAFYPR